MHVVGYTRVSTEEQVREGISLDAQEEKIRAYTVVKDWPLAGLIRDAGHSAKSLKRPGMTRLLAHVEVGQVDVGMVYKLDRLTRSVVDLGKLMALFDRHHVALVSLQESLDATTATGRLMMNLLASVSQWEREVIGERTRDALAHLKAQGERYCHTVYDNPEGIALMHRLRAEGYSYERIAHHLTQAGLPTALGGPWQAMVVYGIVQRTQPKHGRKIA
jgi:DNA invertase Pin-like site-specific DNA recombinase